LHFAVSMTLLGPAFLPTAEPSRMIMLWIALNSPVLVLIDLIKRIFTLPWISPHILPLMAGERAIYFIFLVGGLGLWFLVGRALDNLGGRKTCAQTKVHNLVGLILFASGIRLVFHGLEWILPRYAGERHSAAEIINGLIVLAWSLVLILPPALKFANRFRQRQVAQMRAHNP
jgi:hypothetical protein